MYHHSKMKNEVDFLGGSLNGGQAGRPWAILLVGEKHQQGRNEKSILQAPRKGTQTFNSAKY